MSLAQKSKEHSAGELRKICAFPGTDTDLVAMSGVDNIRSDETQEYQNRQYSEE
jgi:hypothetical protein